MQKKAFLIFLILLRLTAEAQSPSFRATVDSINAIIEANSLCYYGQGEQYDVFVKKIQVGYDGVMSFTDRIAPNAKITNHNRRELPVDCCAQKDSRKLDILTIKKWDIDFPNAYLKNEKGEDIGQFIGQKKGALENLKKHFDVLQSLCSDYVKKRDQAKAKAIADKYRCDLADPKKRAAAETAMKKAEGLDENKK